MNELILHIGTPKTGTSALQRFLYDNPELLKENGYCYPDLLSELRQKGIRFCVEKSEEYKNGVVFGKYRGKGNRADTGKEGWTELWDLVRERLKESHVILSEESIWWWETESFIREIRKQWDALRVLLYLRRQDLYIESDWNQRVKRCNHCSDTFAVSVEKRKNIPVFRYLEKLDGIAKIAGEEAIILRVYEKQQFEGERKDIVSDFLSALGIYPDFGRCRPAALKNERLSGNALEIKRILNRTLGNDEISHKLENMFLNSVVSPSDGEPRREESYYSPGERREVLSRYEEENREIAGKYLHRGDGVLFREEVTTNEIYRPDTATIHESMIEIFGRMSLQFLQKTGELEQRMERTEHKSRLLIWKIIREEGRKMVFWGAGRMCRDILTKYQTPVDFIIDTDSSLGGTTIMNIPVYPPDFVEEWSKLFIIITSGSFCEIEEQLLSRGLKRYADYLLSGDYF